MSNSIVKYLIAGGGSVALLSSVISPNAKPGSNGSGAYEAPQSITVDTPVTPPPAPKKPTLHYPFKDKPDQNPVTNPNSGGLMLDDPANLKTTVVYDPATGKYLVTQTIGGMNYRPPTYMTADEYQKYIFKKQVKDYWNARTHADSKNPVLKHPTIPKLKVGGEVFDRIFGGNSVDIQPNGSAELILGYIGNSTQNPQIPQRNRNVGNLNFDEKIQLNVIGKIGDKLKITTSYNTQATFDFENQMKLDYMGYDDEIIKKIEAGNVSFPLNGTLISGSQTLFGIKTALQFGRLTVTSVAGQEKGKTSTVNVAGGAQTTPFTISADNYDANRHFFLSQHFRDEFNTAMAGLPFVNSQINITRIEVWVTNTNSSTLNIRSTVAFADLAEDVIHIPANQQTFLHNTTAGLIPDNTHNNLYALVNGDSAVRNVSTTISAIASLSGNEMQQQTNYELISSARQLASTEYTLNPLLGYISLKQQLLPAQALSVAYQYTQNGKTYQVGEFSVGGVNAPKALITKMLKSTAANPSQPMWNLMMKNIYSLGGYQIQPQNFMLNVFYKNKLTGTNINYLPVSECQTAIKGRPLIQVLRLDRLDQQNDVQPDGMYDFIDGVTINSANGLVIFSTVEPFGQYLESQFEPSCSSTEAAGYAFPQLYDSTKTQAQQLFPQLDRFTIAGSYQSSASSDISLGSPNIAKGSVAVIAGGVTLTENVDYTVDYTLGRVKIINDAILSSGTPITIKSGSNALFNQQQKTVLGTHFDYKINKNFTVGATAMHLLQKPMNSKVNVGTEPVSNTQVGVDEHFKTDAPFLTRFIDKLPFISTKAPSSITSSGEAAYMIPGYNHAIGSTGTTYVDDFEATQSSIDLRSPTQWALASTPQGQTDLFPEGNFPDSLAYGYNRAKLAWYTIDPSLLVPNPGLTPPNLTAADMSNNFVREVLVNEVFPSQQLSNGVPPNISTMDLAYYPTQIGPYNYDTKPTSISSGIDANGNLLNPTSRWGGIERALQTTDFQANNISYIQMWIMDPFNGDNPKANWNTSGDLYFDIGNISEDILKDGQRASENGLPTNLTPAGTIPTVWGQVPSVQPLLNTFNQDPSERPYQDIGFDGVADATGLSGEETEQTQFKKYLNSVQGIVSSAVYSAFSTDPSHDDFHYFRGSDYDALNYGILQRYVQYNGTENNSPVAQNGQSFIPSSTSLPDVEDINHDNNLSTAENYYQYHISLKPSDFAAGVGNNYITNVLSTYGQNIQDGATKPIKWYQFKIPLAIPDKAVGGINNMLSMRFMRMFIKGVDRPIVLRFADLSFLREDWRTYLFNLEQPGLYVPNDVDPTIFTVGAVNLQENGDKQPVNYVLPPGINRQVAYGTTNTILLNEQSMDLEVCNLQDGDARAAYKNTTLDVRMFKQLQMYLHCEASTTSSLKLKNNDLHAFIRLGTDYSQNYYEYEIPLQLTPPGIYDGTVESQQSVVWPTANDMIIDFAKLTAAKEARNALLGNTTTQAYTVPDGTRNITIVGNPNLAAVTVIMLGVRNPKRTSANESIDDGLPKCGGIWFDELRLTGFIENGGGAATGNVTAQLADLGSVSLSGNIYTPGWGSIDNTASQLSKQTLKQYNLTTNLQLDKFLPENANIKIPMYAGYSEIFISPQYDPLAPDLLLNNELTTMTKAKGDSLKKIVVDYTRTQTLNFTNVKKVKGKDSKNKNHFYDIENWALTGGYNETFHRNITIDYNITRNMKGNIAYAYTADPKNITPFSKINFLNAKPLQLIKDFNFYPYPKQIGFSTNANSNFNSNHFRDVTGGEVTVNPTYNQKIVLNRNYNVSYPITKELKIDFTAANFARVLEPYGLINTKEKKDTVLNNFIGLGKTTNYNSQVNVTYNIPINKLPFLNFTKASVKYTGTYTWTRAPFGADSLGNTIQNSKAISWTGDINMVTLYNKSEFIKRLTGLSTKPKIKAIKAKNGSDSTKKAKTVTTLPFGMKAKNGSDSTKKAKKVKALPLGPVVYVARLLTSLKNINASYSVNGGTILPGYKQFTNIMGMDNNFWGPTLGFVLGDQKDIRPTAIKNDWLVRTQSINTPYTTTSSQNINIVATLEPIKNLKIDVDGLMTQSTSYSDFFRWNRDSANYVNQSAIQTGNFSMSFLSYKTSFANGNTVFQTFLADRTTISTRLGAQNPNSHGFIDGYARGYNGASQDVLIPAFLAAYAGQSPGRVQLTNFPTIPKPNWKINYDGLSKLPKVKKYFKTVTLSNSYKSTYNVAGYTSNLLYQADANGNANGLQAADSTAIGNPNFIQKNVISAVTITEQWSPLIKVDMVLNNSMLANITFNRNRNLSLGLANQTITEIDGNEIIIGTGYRFKNVSFSKNFRIQGKPVKSDLNLICNVSIRRNQTSVRLIEQDYNQTTAGTQIISLKLSADYTISNKLVIRIFYDRIINNPLISNSYPTANTNAGVSLRLALSG